MFVTFSVTISAQTNKMDDADKLAERMCLELKNSENKNDTIKTAILKEKYFTPYLKQFSASERKSKYDHLFVRFQKLCEEFRALLSKANTQKNNENWVTVEKKPAININEKDLQLLKKSTDLYYFEASGKKVFVKTDNKYWTETFDDKTNSILYYKWLSANRFELEFIESNNVNRKSFSKKGEKYLYEVLSKENNYYWIMFEIPGQNRLVKFKLFAE